MADIVGATPAAEIEIDEHLVRELLRHQHGDLAGREIQLLDSGWDNVLFRLGDDLLVRLPRRAVAADLVRNEMLWAPTLAPLLPLAVPVPERIGLPSDRFPWWWAVNRYFEGESGLAERPLDPGAAADVLGRFVAALRRPAPAAAPTNPWRGVPLPDRDEVTRERIARLGPRLEEAGGAVAVTECWRQLVATAPWTAAPSWVHGDLHPGNLVVRDGRVVAVIDFGDICGGDPATDLLVGWLLFDSEHRERFRAAAAADDAALWARGRGWAMVWSLAVMESSADRPDLAAVAEAGLAAVLAGGD